jgi:hypothetical protein
MSTLSCCTDLEVLDLMDSALEELPEEITALQGLEVGVGE